MSSDLSLYLPVFFGCSCDDDVDCCDFGFVFVDDGHVGCNGGSVGFRS